MLTLQNPIRYTSYARFQLFPSPVLTLQNPIRYTGRLQEVASLVPVLTLQNPIRYTSSAATPDSSTPNAENTPSKFAIFRNFNPASSAFCCVLNMN